MEQRDGGSKRKLRNLHKKKLPDVVSVQPRSLQIYSGGTRIKIRPGQRNELTETLRHSSMPIPANSNRVSLIKQLPF